MFVCARMCVRVRVRVVCACVPSCLCVCVPAVSFRVVTLACYTCLGVFFGGVFLFPNQDYMYKVMCVRACLVISGCVAAERGCGETAVAGERAWSGSLIVYLPLHP